jgi:hypothetical protein
MDEVLKASPPESPAAESRRWIGRFLIAVVLGEAIWGFLVSITTNLAQPAMSRVLGADPQSPLYLGRGDINVPALFTSVVELCFAGIAAVILNAWTQKPVRTVVVRQRPVAMPQPASAPNPAPVPSSAPLSISAPVATPAPVVNAPVAAPADSPAPAAAAAIPTTPPEPTVQPAPQEKRSPQSVAPATPKKPKKVYYNIVGEAIESDDE